MRVNSRPNYSPCLPPGESNASLSFIEVLFEVVSNSVFFKPIAMCWIHSSLDLVWFRVNINHYRDN